jgi:hypothetical protein
MNISVLVDLFGGLKKVLYVMYDEVNTGKGAAINIFIRWPFPGRGPIFVNHYSHTVTLLRSFKLNNLTCFARRASQKRILF